MSTVKTTADLERLAYTIRRTYIIQRGWVIGSSYRRDGRLYIPGPHWDGGFKGGTKRKPIWPRIAQFVCDEEIDDPDDYIRYNFEITVALPPKPPMPNHLLSRKRMADYKKSLPTRREVELINVTVDRTHAVGELKTIEHRMYYDCDGSEITGRQSGAEVRRTALKIFSFEQSNIAPLFVYCMAHFSGCPEIAEERELDAALIYWRRRNSYDQAWSSAIPSGWRAKAAILNEKACEILLAGR